MVPLLPDRVRGLLRTQKIFTTDSDKEKVANLYETFFNAVSNSVTELS